MTGPYYQDECVTLYHGDVMTLAPSLCLHADAVITDPPYGETSLEWDKWPEGWPAVAAKVTSQMWCFGSLRMFMDKSYDLKGWKLAQDIVWQKHNGSNPSNDRFRRVHEMTAHFYREGEAWSDLFKSPVFTNSATARTVRRKKRPPHWGEIGESVYESHDGGPRLEESVIYCRSCHGYATNETQKPEGIVRPLIQYSVPTGGTVVDFFAGSGTVLAVAREMGRKAIGFEKRESQCQDIVKRLSQGLLLL